MPRVPVNAQVLIRPLFTVNTTEQTAATLSLSLLSVLPSFHLTFDFFPFFLSPLPPFLSSNSFFSTLFSFLYFTFFPILLIFFSSHFHFPPHCLLFILISFRSLSLLSFFFVSIPFFYFLFLTHFYPSASLPSLVFLFIPVFPLLLLLIFNSCPSFLSFPFLILSFPISSFRILSLYFVSFSFSTVPLILPLLSLSSTSFIYDLPSISLFSSPSLVLYQQHKHNTPVHSRRKSSVFPLHSATRPLFL